MRRVVAILLAAAFGGAAVLAAPSAGAADPVTFTTIEKLYGPKPDLQKLTVYVPDAPGDKKPAILFVHGGCWSRGYLNSAETALAQELVKRTGYVVATMTYRQANPKYAYQPADVVSALKALQSSPELKVDSTRTALWGESAGAQLSLLTAYRSTGKPGYGRPAAVVSISGVANMLSAYASALATCVADFEGGPPSTLVRVKRYQETSATKYVDGADPATFLAHAVGDVSAPYSQSANLAQMLNAKGVPNTFVSVANNHHATPLEYDVPTGMSDRVYVLALHFLIARFAQPA
ncbi:MAG: hypothetical protein QOG53_3594 [Frankiales bacterium]|jgi:acetyl esterase/lipase|nr:hypothetical protein [Frankiales bacterium]